MKAARIHGVRAPIQIDEVATPQIGNNDVLVKPIVCGISGGDIDLWHGTVPVTRLPLIINHTSAGIIEEVGRDVQGYKPGDRVGIAPLISCRLRSCRYCATGEPAFCPHVGVPGMGSFDFNSPYGRELWEPYADGAMARYWKMPAYSCTRIPDAVTWDNLAVMSAIGGYHAAVAAKIEPGQTVVVHGATGVTGAMAIKTALLFNPAMVIAIGRSSRKLERIQGWRPKVIRTVSSIEGGVGSKISTLTGGWGADRLIDLAPRQAVATTEECIYALRRRGRAILYGAGGDTLRLSYQFLMIYGITIEGQLAAYPHDMPAVFDLMAQGLLDTSDMLTHRYPLEDAHVAHMTFAEKTDDAMGVVVYAQE